MKNNIKTSLQKYTTFVQLLGVIIFLLFLVVTTLYFFPNILNSELKSDVEITEKKESKAMNEDFTNPWTAPSDWRMMREANAEEIRYGKELISNTAFYLGFNGTVMKNTNGQNCQNCHLKAGTQPFGNNFLGVASMYPQIRKRSGKLTDIYGRVNGCLQRSLNGHALDSTNREMKAMVAYIKWVGQDSPKGVQPIGSKIYNIKLLKRAANPIAGEKIYQEKCQSCHQENGQGVLSENGRTFTYPPLWGKYAYNDGAGLFRMSKFAGFVRLNMPFGATFENPQLTDEEAWDVAAFVNSQPRPTKDRANDWPNIADKPFDHPFGPYTDSFSEEQHKYGPFGPIQAFYKKK